ncbi:MAG: 3-ketoacyl-ACP reductase [Candidatus Lokiarchaeota archaeon]|nr:3-ketoacyl-ACP reductase [Candidatus Lokiarchaeota archaeon]
MALEDKYKKVALITGSTRGIGKSIALKLLSKGFNIVLNGVSKAKLPVSLVKELTEIISSDSLSAHTLYVKANIARQDDRKHLINATLEKFSRIDVLINNAGVAPLLRQDILNTTEESYDRVMDINLKGPFFLTQSLAKIMKNTLNSKKLLNYKPMIINISSISAYTSSPYRSQYCLSKAGIAMMTKLYADRLAEYGINVYEIRPGIIKTDMTVKVQDKYDKLFKEGITPIERWGSPEDIAKAVFAVVNNNFPYSTGQVFDIDGGFHLKRL